MKDYCVVVLLGGKPTKVLVNGRLMPTTVTRIDGLVDIERRYSDRNARRLSDEDQYEVRHVEVHQ